jgi:hypothetical protein
MTRALSIVAVLVFTTPALAHHHARHNHHRYHHQHHRHSTHHRPSVSHGEASGERPSDCHGIPWCGCFMRHLLGVADKAFNLAREWASYGHATTAHVGAIVVWPHHVGKIVGRDGGKWVVLSGNDGHRVRERPRSIAGAIAFRE